MFPDLSDWQPTRERIKERFDNACNQLAGNPGDRFWMRELIAAYNAAEQRGMIEPVVEHVRFCDVCGSTEAHAHNPSNIGGREWFAGVDEIEFN